jgi:P27 family predicted phage terminase small subunit
MAGRRPKPTALKELQGNPGKRALNKNEPKPTGIPTCPSHLDRIAKAEWKRVSYELLSVGLLTVVDRSALGAYCAAFARWVKAEKELQNKPAVVKAPSGYPMPNPYIGIANSALDLMRKFLTEFGMTPASRSRIHVEPAGGGADPFAAFMASIGAEDTSTDDVCRQSAPVLPGCNRGEDSGEQVD